MSWADLFRRRPASSSKTAEIRALVGRVASYIQSHPERNEFFPGTVAEALKESEAVTLVAFGELNDAGIVSPRWATYCRASSEPIDEYDSLQDVRDGFCTGCAEAISVDDGSMYVEVYFLVDRRALDQFLRKAA